MIIRIVFAEDAGIDLNYSTTASPKSGRGKRRRKDSTPRCIDGRKISEHNRGWMSVRERIHIGD